MTGEKLQTIPNGQSIKVLGDAGLVEVYEGQPRVVNDTTAVRGALIGVVRLVDPVGAVILGE